MLKVLVPVPCYKVSDLPQLVSTQQSPVIATASRSGLAFFYGIHNNGHKGSNIIKAPLNMKNDLKDSKEGPIVKTKGKKVVSEKLPGSILETMKGRKISDLFGFIK